MFLISMVEMKGTFVLASFFPDQQQLSDILLVFGILVVLKLYNWVYMSSIQNHHSSVAESSLRLVRQAEKYQNLMTPTNYILILHLPQD